MVKQTHEVFTRIAPYVITITLALLTALASANMYFVQEKNEQLKTIRDDVGEIKTDVAVIDGNRFTSEDGKEVWQEIATIQATIAAMPKEVPPPLFKEKVDGIGQDVQENRKQLAHIHEEVAENSDKIDGVSATVLRIEAKL